MNKREAIYVLYGLIADINAEEIADHIKIENLRMWSNRWRNTAKDALRVLEETEPKETFTATTSPCIVKAEQTEPQLTPNYCATCKYKDTPFDDLPCDMCKSYSAYEPKTEPQTVVIMGTPSNEFKLKNGQTGNEPMLTIAKTEPQTDCAWR